MSGAAIARGGIVQCPETRELFGDMTVRENLDLGGYHLPDKMRADQLKWLFELFPILESRQAQTARTLSGGEQQMLAIARALMMQPKLLILDEPTLGLAPVILEQLSKAMELMQKTTPITVLLGEQNVTFVWEGSPSRFEKEMGRGFLEAMPSEPAQVAQAKV
jgi:ABC-type branched-subunit amino acid transport system ATPase component